VIQKQPAFSTILYNNPNPPLPLNRQTGIYECLTTNNAQQVKNYKKKHQIPVDNIEIRL
jgi:hypothetical protein